MKRGTLSPIYNESFSYEIEDSTVAADVNNVQLLFYVLDSDFFSHRDNSMGVVKIGKDADSGRSGKEHWTQVLQFSCQRITLWHPIQPLS